MDEKTTRDNYEITKEDVLKYKDAGYLKMNKFFSKSFIEYLKNQVEPQICSPKDNFGVGFHKFKYDLLNNDEKVLDFVKSEKFNSLVQKLIGRPLLYTQGISFCLEKNNSPGFPWHVGTQSFGFQRLEDYGCTIWIPLVPIHTKEQGGGMAYVPKNKFSGEFVYQHIDCVPGYVNNLVKNKNKEEGLKEFLEVKNSLLNSKTMGPLLDQYAEEDDFELGDAIIFDKYVLHRSIPLREGPINTRSVFVMRFCDVDSRYDKNRVEKLDFARKNFSFSGSSDFNTRVCQNDGDLIIDSPLFPDVSNRTIDINGLPN